jgi:hypothetical protein
MLRRRVALQIQDKYWQLKPWEDEIFCLTVVEAGSVIHVVRAQTNPTF